MKITQITIGASRTINLGNYESMQVQGSCTIEFDGSEKGTADKDPLVIARETAIEECKKQMNEAYKSIRPKK